MKLIETYSIDPRLVELLRRYSQAMSCSKSSIVENALKDFFESGGPRDNLKSEYQKKEIRTKFLEQQEKELIDAIKGSRSISLKECGDRNE